MSRERTHAPLAARRLIGLGGDLRFALRQLRRAPAFTTAAVLCLGLGVGAATTIVTVVDAVLLRPLPFADSNCLVRLAERVTTQDGRTVARNLTYQQLVEWGAASRTLSAASAVMATGQTMVRTRQGVAGLWGGAVSADTFTFLGVTAMLGRTLLPSDEAGQGAVVLSFDTWQRFFNADRSVVGTAIELRPGALQGPRPAQALTVVGVLPPGVELPTGALDFYTTLRTFGTGRSPRVTAIARLAAGVSLEAAQQEANAIAATLLPPVTAAATVRPRVELTGLKDLAVRPVRPALRVLLTAIVIVLLIVCANVATLLLARGHARTRELALRAAVGASRGRLVRQLATEALVLALLGGMAGALIGTGGVALVHWLAAVEVPGIFRLMFGRTILPRATEIGVSLRVPVTAFAIAALTSLIVALLPALRLSRTTHLAAIGSATTTASRTDTRVRAGLVIAQLAMATVLLIGAGLLVRSFAGLVNAPNGYDPSRVVALNLLFPESYSTARKIADIDALLARFRRLPGVEGAGFARHGLLIGEAIVFGTFVPPGQSLEQMRETPALVRSVSDGYLSATGIPIVSGRELAETDATGEPAVVINRSAARLFFGTTPAVGRTLDWHTDTASRTVRVVGVVEDVRQESPLDDVRPEVFVHVRAFLSLLEQWRVPPARQNEFAIGFQSFALRVTGDPDLVAPSVRAAVAAVDPDIGVDAVVPMRRLVASSIARERFYAVTLGLFAVVAALLAASGIYGVLAYAVSQRTQEIGIRMALGARRAIVLRGVLGHGLMLAACGIALGLGGALASTRLLQDMLVGTSPLDAETFALVTVGFLAVVTLASLVPARRATKVDPVVALRHS